MLETVSRQQLMYRVFKRTAGFNLGIICIKAFSIIFAFLSYNYMTLQFEIGYQGQIHEPLFIFYERFRSIIRKFFLLYNSIQLNCEHSYNIRLIQELLFKQINNASRKVNWEEKSSFLDFIDLQRMQKAKMSPNGCTNAKRAQCVLWIVVQSGKQQYRDCSWRNTKKVLHQGLPYENGTKHINQRESCTQG